jgi:limonene-1,2-epoxide hydrolase
MPDPTASKPPVVPALDGEAVSPQEVVEAFLANISDLDVAMRYIADDIVYENIATFPLPTMRSRAASKRFLGAAFKLGTDFKIEVHHIAADGPVVLTERSDMFMFGDVPARFWVCGRFEVRDGKIVHWRDYFSNGNFLLGVTRGAVKGMVAKALRR